jgi:dTDP-4-dehydrorhamnose 3,5-epimerase-like enzyme
MEHNPRIIEFPSIGESKLGFISIAEKGDLLPFDIKRVYWTYYTPQNVIRGFHAHKQLKQIIFAVAGTISITTENQQGEKNFFILNKPKLGLFIPASIWREIQFSHTAVLLCLASEVFNEDDYIRDYEAFKNEY